MADSPDLSLQAQTLLEAGERVVSTDEMTGIQALERTHPTLAMGPGRVERQEFADNRHGTLRLMANVAVAPGHIGSPSLGPTRTEDDLGAHIKRTVASAPAATRWHWVAENLNTHPSESVGGFVAEHEGLTADLGQKGTRGLLQSMPTRAALLADATHRMVFHYTPKHASWMPQIAMGFRLLVRQVLKRASFTSGEDLQANILAFIAYCNETMAKPFTWTYGRKPLHA